ncbi:MAG: Ig-like domain-containing protein [Thermodesulfovibrionales bacterium]|nr:Ig-like domain-containing protein [Thermodesulfovibrionales bacterium]
MPDTQSVTEQQETTGEKTEGGSSSAKPEIVQQPRTINTAPRITKFNVEPQTPVAGDTIKAQIEVFDREGDDVRVLYQWTKNDIPLEETSNRLLLTHEFKRGDKLSVKATPDDEKVKGASLTVVVSIANASPVVKGEPEPFKLDGNMYTYQMKATDPDGDELAFALKEAPSGMTIDPKKGFIQWKVPPDFTGTSSHTVSVTDGHGGETTGTFAIEIQAKQIRR